MVQLEIKFNPIISKLQEAKESIEKWDKLIKAMPAWLKTAIKEVEEGEKDKYSDKRVTMNSSGKNYIYVNQKGKPNVPWNKNAKEEFGDEFFGFLLYYERKRKGK